MDITTVEQLEAIYNLKPTLASTAKVSTSLTEEYRRYIEASPFVALATSGPEGLDCSPRGDIGAVIDIVDGTTLALPDRRGNNRIDSLRNIVRDPRIALLFLIPGSGTTLRINGTARISINPALLEKYAREGKQPRSVVLIKISECYFQCARALKRSDLWNPQAWPDISNLPTPGQVLAKLTRGEIDGKAYDEEWPGRAAKTMW